MQFVAAALKGYAIESSDGVMGTVSDLLFDDTTWTTRWLVVDTGKWLPGRKVLLHPSVIGKPDHDAHIVPVSLTMERVRDSPDITSDQPVSRQLEASLFTYYGWDPMWGGSSFYGNPLVAPMAMPPGHGDAATLTAERARFADDGDPHLRSVAEVKGYHIHATDGAIGYVQDILIEDADWAIQYLIVDTRDWLPGRHVLISPHAVTGLDWPASVIALNVTREQVNASPPWDVMGQIDKDYAAGLHRHYRWPGYGW